MKIIEALIVTVFLFFISCVQTDKNITLDLFQVNYEIPKHPDSLQGVLYLTKGIDTIFNANFVVRERLARMHKYKKFSSSNSKEAYLGWSCELINENLELLTNFGLESNLLEIVMNELRIDKFTPEVFNILSTQGFFQNLSSSKVEDCEKKYYNSLREILAGNLKMNSDRTQYHLMGLDSCQILEILKIETFKKNLTNNQSILTPSACEVMNIDDNLLTNKPYFLVTVHELERRKLKIDLELLNHGFFWEWIDL